MDRAILHSSGLGEQNDNVVVARELPAVLALLPTPGRTNPQRSQLRTTNVNVIWLLPKSGLPGHRKAKARGPPVAKASSIGAAETTLLSSRISKIALVAQKVVETRYDLTIPWIKMILG